MACKNKGKMKHENMKSEEKNIAQLPKSKIKKPAKSKK